MKIISSILVTLLLILAVIEGVEKDYAHGAYTIGLIIVSLLVWKPLD